MARTLLAILAAVTLSLTWPSPVHAATAASAGAEPRWSRLTPQQKQILAPLAEEWDGFPVSRRQKWLGIAKRYPAMSPEQQQRVQTQMKPWASLSAQERSAARANFKRKKNIETTEQREVRRKKWEQYQALPESEKMKLREKSVQKKTGRQSKSYVSRPLTQPVPTHPGNSPAQ